MTQSHLIVKEEGICIYRHPETQIGRPRGQYEYEIEQAQSSAILVEDQERAMDLIHEIEYQKWRANGKYIIKIGSIYPVPGIEFEEERQYRESRPEDCKPVPWKKLIYAVGQDGYDFRTVARLIEHTAEKESPEIDKEEERKTVAKILRDNITFSGQIGDYVIHGAIDKIIEWANTRKP